MFSKGKTDKIEPAIFNEIEKRSRILLAAIENYSANLKPEVDGSGSAWSMRAWGMCKIVSLLRDESKLSEDQAARVAHLSVPLMTVVARVGADFGTAGPLECLELPFCGGRLPADARAWVLERIRPATPEWIEKSRERDRERELRAVEAAIAIEDAKGERLERLRAERARLLATS